MSVAIVTGSSRGIGRAIALRLADAGAKVVVNYQRDRSAAESVVAAVYSRGGEALAVKADVSSPTEIEALFDAAEARFGRPSTVVASAGTSVFAPHAFVPEADFDRVFGLNARGTFFVLQQAARRVVDGGRIVAVSTGGTTVASAGAGLYTASKAAVERFVTSLAVELGPRGITANVVSPGLTRTDGLVLPEPLIAAMVAQTPLGRLGEPEDVAEVVAFLASPAGRWVTGQNLRASGGL